MVKTRNRKVELLDIDKDNIHVKELYFKHHSTPKELLCDEVPDAKYYLVYNEHSHVIGMTSFRELSPKLIMTERTILYPTRRGMGYGKLTSQALERLAIHKGYHKMTSEVFTFNEPMVMLKLKENWTIEACLRDHDGPGLDCYVMSKWIKKSSLQAGNGLVGYSLEEES